MSEVRVPRHHQALIREFGLRAPGMLQMGDTIVPVAIVADLKDSRGVGTGAFERPALGGVNLGGAAAFLCQQGIVLPIDGNLLVRPKRVTIASDGLVRLGLGFTNFNLTWSVPAGVPANTFTDLSAIVNSAALTPAARILFQNTVAGSLVDRVLGYVLPPSSSSIVVPFDDILLRFDTTNTVMSGLAIIAETTAVNHTLHCMWEWSERNLNP